MWLLAPCQRSFFGLALAWLERSAIFDNREFRSTAQWSLGRVRRAKGHPTLGCLSSWESVIMDREERSGADTGAKLFRNPWPALFGGLAANAAACVWFRAADSQVLPLLLLGLLSSGAAVAIRPRSGLGAGLGSGLGMVRAPGVRGLGFCPAPHWGARCGGGLRCGCRPVAARSAHHRQRDDCAALCRHFHGRGFCAADARRS